MRNSIKLISGSLLLWLVLMGTACSRAEEGQATDGGIRVLTLYDGGEAALEEIAASIQEKMGGDCVPIQEAPDLTSYDLILVGGTNQDGELSSVVQSYLETTDFQGKRISPFWIETKSGQTDNMEEGYETRFGQAVQNGAVLPGISLVWNEAMKQEESSRMDGWLTSACTLKIKEDEKSGSLDFSSSFCSDGIIHLILEKGCIFPQWNQ